MSLDDIRAREQAATEGPWDRFDAQIRHTKIDGWVDPSGRRAAQEQTERDIQFVMNARTDIPFLLDERDKLRAALDAVLAMAEEWRYKGEFGWGAWQEGRGPDLEGATLDDAAHEIRAAITEALR